MYAKWCTMSNLAVPIFRLYDFMDWILCIDNRWLDEWWFKTILSDMNTLYRHIRPKKRWNTRYPKYPMILRKKSGADWVLPKIIGSDRVVGTRQALVETCTCSVHLQYIACKVYHVQFAMCKLQCASCTCVHVTGKLQDSLFLRSGPHCSWAPPNLVYLESVNYSKIRLFFIFINPPISTNTIFNSIV